MKLLLLKLFTVISLVTLKPDTSIEVDGTYVARSIYNSIDIYMDAGDYLNAIYKKTVVKLFNRSTKTSRRGRIVYLKSWIDSLEINRFDYLPP